MTVIDQLNILDNKIRANRAQYDLDRKKAEISELSSGEVEKCEYLTGEDLKIMPSVVSKTKFEYSSLGKSFNKLFREDKKVKEVLDITIIYFTTRFIILINTVSLILMKYHQMILNLIQ